MKAIIIFGVIALLAATPPAFAGCPAAPLGEPVVMSISTIEVCHAGYASLLDPSAKETRVVTYALTAEHSHGHASRAGMKFNIDTLVAAEDQGRTSDYVASGYDLGRMMPADDAAWDTTLERETLMMTNVVPQFPGLNRQGWEELESIVRAEACYRGTVVVFTGPVFGARHATIGKGHLAVPAAFFKVAVDPATGWAIAFLAPQRNLIKGAAAKTSATSIAKIEQAAKIKLPLPATVDVTHVTVPDGAALARYRQGSCGT